MLEYYYSIMRGRYIYGGKAEKHKKSGGKPEKEKKFCGKPEKRSVAETGKRHFWVTENLKISAENGKLSFKTAETGKQC